MADRHTVVPRVMSFIFNNKGDKTLLMKASDKKEWVGTYDPVGGHIEKGESIIDAAIREIKEEAGIDVSETKLRGIVHVSNFFGKNVMLFVTASKTDATNITGSDEGLPEWLDLKTLDSINVFEDVKPMLKHILEMKVDELFIGSSEFDGKDKLLSFDIKIS